MNPTKIISICLMCSCVCNYEQWIRIVCNVTNDFDQCNDSDKIYKSELALIIASITCVMYSIVTSSLLLTVIERFAIWATILHYHHSLYIKRYIRTQFRFDWKWHFHITSFCAIHHKMPHNITINNDSVVWCSTLTWCAN